MPHSGVTVVVPAHNEATTISEVVVALREHFSDVVCVDDGSTDETSELARRAGAQVIRHAVNLGQGAALQTGFEYVLRQRDSKFVVTFDADGQHDPLDAVAMVDVAAASNLDVVLGSRIAGSTSEQPLSRRWLLRLAVLFTRLTTGLPVTDTHNGLRVISRETLSSVRLRLPGMAHASELESAIASLGLQWREVPVTIRYTPHSRSKGQGSLNAVNIIYDLAVARLRAKP